MSVTASESSSPIDEPQFDARRKRTSRLARVVFDLMGERSQGGSNHQFDGVEDAELIDALRVCSDYTEQIGCRDLGDAFVVIVEGIDGHTYIIQFSIFDPSISVHAARVGVAKLSLDAGQEVQQNGPNFTIHDEASSITLDVLQDYSKRHKLGKVTMDRALLVGMSLVIGFMDDQDEDPDEVARLEPLSALVRPNEDELREIRAKVPPSGINYDQEGDLPY